MPLKDLAPPRTDDCLPIQVWIPKKLYNYYKALCLPHGWKHALFTVILTKIAEELRLRGIERWDVDNDTETSLTTLLESLSFKQNNNKKKHAPKQDTTTT